MKFFCLLPVRDEADIIAQCLQQLLTWSDGIFVFDTGSVDNTWEIIQDLASRNSKIHPIAKDDVYYSESRLRGFIFHQARQHMKDGDWFLRVDADEFHYMAPQDFIREYMKKYETIAYHQYYNFELRKSDVQKLSSVESIELERLKPIGERRRHYTISEYSEPRLCRYRSTMQWPPEVSFPYNAGFVAKERLPILHYPNRDPMQMERRCRLRSIMLADKENKLNWSNMDIHWTIEDWREFLIDDNDPALHFWKPGTILSEVKQYNHIAPLYRRVPQRILHSFFLPLMDRRRRPFSNDGYPKKLSPDVIELLRTRLQIQRSGVC